MHAAHRGRSVRRAKGRIRAFYGARGDPGQRQITDQWGEPTEGDAVVVDRGCAHPSRLGGDPLREPVAQQHPARLDHIAGASLGPHLGAPVLRLVLRREGAADLLAVGALADVDHGPPARLAAARDLAADAGNAVALLWFAIRWHD